MFRIFDHREKKWVRENIFLTPMNDLYVLNEKRFRKKRLQIVADTRYTCQKDIDLFDVNGRLIFEGDICKISPSNAVGVIAYIPERASYYLLDEENLKYYPLTKERCRQMEIIGNIMENDDLIHHRQEEHETQKGCGT